MKKSLFFAVAAIALASCQNDEFATSGSNSGKSQISFGMGVPTTTRATSLIEGKEAAARLGDNFLVHGFKYYGTEPTTDLTDPTKQQEVFDYYNVNYLENSEQSTQTNTAGWEYAGYLTPAGEEQTIKYWDYEASGYVFSAVAGKGLTAEKIEATEPVTSVYEKGWNVIIPSGASLSDLYASARVPMPKPATGTKYNETVKLTFYSMVTKVRFAIYETVPGYKVSIDRFYYKGEDKWHKDNEHFAVTGKFRTLNPFAATPVKVTYYDNTTAIENRPKISVDESNVGKSVCMTFGTNIQAQDAIGSTSVEATYDQAGKEYTYILPYADADNTLTLYVDYTLTANNGETIHVKHASAQVPANYTQWKENFAYTYLFKISDKTNGTTGNTGDPVDPSGDPDDPTGDPDDPAGLYPITFDACVISSEEGIQETVTTVSEPSITTYQNGTVVTANDEYTEGDIYYTVMEDDALVDINSASQVFEVYNYGTETVTEAVLKNWKNNQLILTPVKTTAATAVPLSDGTKLSFAANKCFKFAALPGKLYAVRYTKAGEETYKLIKVVGTDASDPDLYVSVASGQVISRVDGTAVAYVKNSNGKYIENQLVEGAKSQLKVFKGAQDVTNDFIITDCGAGKYTFQCTEALVKAGADGEYTIKCRTMTSLVNFTVNLNYAFASSKNTVTVVAGGSTDKVTLRCGAPLAALADADIICDVKGLTVADTEHNGTYTVTATSAVPFGVYTATIAGQTLTINVDHYAFDKSELIITKKLSGSSTGSVNLMKNGVASEVENYYLEGADYNIASVSGKKPYVFTAIKGGSFTLKYEATQCKVTVNEYALTSTNSSINKSVGATTISLTCNGKVVNATTAHVTCTAQPAGSSYSLTTNGQRLVFSNVTKAGNYTFQYTEDGVVVAEITIPVIE